MLLFDNITKTFKSEFLSQPFKALDRVSFEIPDGSMVGFLGANGAGKTTSLKIIMDFIRPDSGSVVFSKSLGVSREEINKNIGFLPERPYFYPNLSGYDFLSYMGSLSELKRDTVHLQVAKWAPRFRIDHALARPLRTYSKGMLQRIGFLATLIHSPKFVILDEPLSGLDPIGRKEMKDAVIDLHREGTTIFFSTHIVPDVEEVCDRVVFLKEGKLVYDGEVQALLSKRSARYVIQVQGSKESLPDLSEAEIETLPGRENYLIRVPEENKSMILSKILQAGINIKSIESLKPNLEEIFYQIRGDDAQ